MLVAKIIRDRPGFILKDAVRLLGGGGGVSPKTGSKDALFELFSTFRKLKFLI